MYTDIVSFEHIPILGSGLGYREPWYESLISAPGDKVDFLEITADHFMDAPNWKIDQLKELSEKFTLIPHALDLSLGTSEGINEAYIEKLQSVIEIINPPYWSEHLAFTKAGGMELGHLAPLPFSNEAIDVVANNVQQTRDYIKLPLILENITYGLMMPGQEMSESNFITKTLEASNCGWLLDITNLYVNSVNHSFDIEKFLEETPTERVVQLHYVGFSSNDKGYLIDDHGSAVNEEIWKLMDRVLSSCPAKGTILERDSKFPKFNEIIGEIKRAQMIGGKYKRWG